MADWNPEKNFPDSPFMRSLPPLRIPGGWKINLNTLDIASKPEDGDLGGSSLFYATNEGCRFTIDVMFRPEFDPSGSFSSKSATTRGRARRRDAGAITFRSMR
jgi:hypothetical protein